MDRAAVRRRSAVALRQGGRRRGTGPVGGCPRGIYRALDARPNLAAAYLGRALSATHLGQARRVAIDLGVARQLEPGLARRFETAHDREIADLLAAVPRQSAGDLAHRLIDDSRQNVPWPKLVEEGRQVVLASHAQRRRADEQYNDELRRLENLTAADPDNAQRWADQIAADPRVCAYNATICSWQSKPEEAIPFWRAALAIEEARTNLNGQSLLDGSQPLDRQEALMGVMACWGLFRNHAALGYDVPATNVLACMVALQSCATLDSRRTERPFIGMPAPDNPGGPLPAAENASLMASKADLLLARQSLDKGRFEQAALYLTAVRRNGYAGNDPNVRTEVDSTSYDIYRRLSGKYASNELQRFFDGRELHEFDMRDRGVYPRINIAERPGPTVR